VTTVDALAAAVSVVGVLLGGLRWLRVAQREHYLAGSCSRFAWRWWSSSGRNATLVAVGVAGVAVSVVAPEVSGVAGLVAIVGPIGLGVRGRTGPLVWTARLRRVALGSVAIVLGVIGGSIAIESRLSNGARTLGIVALGAPIVIDVALGMLRPLEDRLAMGFVRTAAAKVRRLDPLIVAITGSYGKTSTKGYIAHLLSNRLTVLASPRSFNNRAGLARTVNEHLGAGTDVLVAEMGTYGPGEIRAMCSWLPPKISVITAIGPVHLERFGSLDRTLLAKAEITEHADVVVLNTDDSRLARLGDDLAGRNKRVVRCSALDRTVDVALVRNGEKVEWFRQGSFVGVCDASSPALSAALTNVAAAIGVASELGCSDEEILGLLGTLPVAENRLTRAVAANGALVLDDTFNSNPAGARIALAALAAAPVARRVLVTPGMVELGPLQRSENEAFAAEATNVADDLIIVGRTNRRALLAGATRREDAVRVRTVPTREDAVRWVREELDEHAAVLYENDLPDQYA
jgi:UDP-N-acetylmuramoyl-tripeptide--D-alanyl-D-alanine ligase